MGKQKFTLYLLIFLCAVWVSSTPSNAQSLSDSTIVMGTPHDIENGKGYIRNYYLNYNLVGIGIGDHVFLKAGIGLAELFDRQSHGYLIQPTVSLPINSSTDINLGVTFAQLTNTLFIRTFNIEVYRSIGKSVLQAGLNIGKIDTYAIDSDKFTFTNLDPSFELSFSRYITSRSIIMIENRTFRNIYLEVNDDHLIDTIKPRNTSVSETDFVTTFIYRYISKKASYDAGLVAIYDFPSGNDILFPYLGFVIPFDRFTE